MRSLQPTRFPTTASPALAVVLIWLCSVPVRFGEGLTSLSAFDLFLPVVALLEARARRRSGARLVDRTWLTGFVLAFAAWAAVSGLWATSHGGWLRRCILLAEGLVAAWIASGSVRRSGPACLVTALAASGTFGAVVACVWFYGLDASQDWTAQPAPDKAYALSQLLRLGSPLIGPSNYYASFLLIFIPFTVLKIRDHRAWWLAALLQTFTLISTLSRGALLALPIAALLLLPALKPVKEIRLREWAAGLAGACTLALLGPRMLSAFTARRQLRAAPRPTEATTGPRPTADPVNDAPTPSSTSSPIPPKVSAEAVLNPSGRFDLAEHAIDLFKQHPVGGVGYGNWAARSSPAQATGAHNGYLQIAAELGLVGIALAVAVIAQLARHLHRVADRGLRYAAGCSLLAVALNALVESSVEGVAFFVFLATVLGGVMSFPAVRLRHQEGRRP